MSIQIRRLTGTTPDAVNITNSNTRLMAEDAHSPAGVSNPVLVPSAGTNYSFKASTRLYHDGAGTGKVDNIKWFTDGSNTLGTGVALQVKTEASYTQATGTDGETGDEMTGGTDAFTHTSGNPLSVTGSATDPSSAYIGDIVAMQLTVGSTASAGATGSETITWRYDSTLT